MGYFNTVGLWIQDTYLSHYGTPMHSGRYPYGSGERPYQGDGGTKASYKKAKKDLKDAKRNYKEAKGDYKRSKWYVKDKKSDLWLAKTATKDFKKGYAEAKKSGDTKKASEYKKHLDFDKKNDTIGKSKRALDRAKRLEQVAKKSLVEAKESYDAAKVEKAKQKALYKEGKKRISQVDTSRTDSYKKQLEDTTKAINSLESQSMNAIKNETRKIKDYSNLSESEKEKVVQDIIDSNPKLKKDLKKLSDLEFNKNSLDEKVRLSTAQDKVNKLSDRSVEKIKKAIDKGNEEAADRMLKRRGFDKDIDTAKKLINPEKYLSDDHRRIRESEEKALSKWYEMSMEIDERTDAILKANPKVRDAVRDWSGDGVEYVDRIQTMAKDKKLNRLMEKAESEYMRVQNELSDRHELVNKRYISSLRATGKTNAEIAKKLGISESYVSMLVNE